jgi:Predicted membrane protein (DUF2231)
MGRIPLKAMDLRSMFLAKHAQHVVLIHFPIALFLTGVLFDFVAHWTKRSILAAAAFANLITATVSVPVVMASGILAWQWQLGGQKPRHLAAAPRPGVDVGFAYQCDGMDSLSGPGGLPARCCRDTAFSWNS